MSVDKSYRLILENGLGFAQENFIKGVSFTVKVTEFSFKTQVGTGRKDRVRVG